MTTERTTLNEALPCGISFADLYENAPCGYHVLDRRGVFLDINRTGLAWLGVSREELVGLLRPTDFFDDFGKQVFAANFPRFLAGEELRGLELTLCGKNGERRAVVAHVTPILDARGEVFASRSVLQDVSDLQALRKAQAKTLAEQSALLDADIVGMAKIANRRFTWLSRGAERMFGYAPGELVGQPTRVLFDSDVDYATIGAAVAHRHAFSQQRMRFRRNDGTYVWTSSRAVPLGNDEHLSVFVDVSAEVRAEELAQRAAQLALQNEQLRDLRRLRDRMMRDFSHELRTPLNAVLGFSELLMADLSVDDAQRDEFLALIHGAGQLLLALSDRMLDAGSAEAETWEVTPSDIDVMREVHETVELFTDMAAAKEVRIVVTGSLDGTPFRTDPVRFRQALASYLDNAIRFSPPRTRVDVSVLQKDAQLRITVQDLGRGPSRAETAYVYSQAAPPTPTERGLGLSLDLVRALIKQQGGSVHVDSAAGLGSVFEFCLPSA